MNIYNHLTHTGVVDGKILARQIQKSLKKQVAQLKVQPVVFLVAINPPAQTRIYMNMKQRLAAKIGITVVQRIFPKSVGMQNIQRELLKETTQFVNTSVSIIVQLPIPKEYSLEKLMNIIPQAGDPDILLEHTRKQWLGGQMYPELLVPPVAGAVREVFEHIGLWRTLSDLHVNIVVVGRGLLVGQAVSDMLQLAQVEHAVIDLETSKNDRLAFLQNADVIISGAGDPWHIAADMVKDDVVIIDAGTMSVDGELRGDVHPDVYQKASVYTPVPGCVGPLSLVCLMRNIIVCT